MCQPKPGPRCSSHARAHVLTTRANLARATDAYTQASQVAATARAEFERLQWTRKDSADYPARLAAEAEAARTDEAAYQALIAKNQADEAYSEAKRLWASTPDGQEHLQAAITRLADEGDTLAVRQAQRALTAARDERAEQTAALAHQRLKKRALASATPEDRQALDGLRATVHRAEEHLATVQPAGQHAQEQYAAAQAAHAEARRGTDQEAIHRTSLDLDVASRAYNTPTQTVREAEKSLANAQAELSEAEERVAVGATTSARTLPWQSAGSQMARNPDGSTNAWVWRDGKYGLPGRYVRAVGVGTADNSGQGSASALVLEDGSKAWRSVTYSRPRGQTVSGPDKVLIGPVQPGATPLRDEAPAGTFGFVSHLDSTG